MEEPWKKKLRFNYSHLEVLQFLVLDFAMRLLNFIGTVLCIETYPTNIAPCAFRSLQVS